MATRVQDRLSTVDRTTIMTPEAYERLALAEPGVPWELHQGRLREKPAMSIGHNRTTMNLTRQLHLQLDPERFEVRANLGRARRGETTYYIPDVSVIPKAPSGARLDALEVFTDPLPLVVEVWSPSTGNYDVDTKVPEYRARGDKEIWRLHPFERTLVGWRRQPTGRYVRFKQSGGTVEPVALSGIVIDLDALFV